MKANPLKLYVNKPSPYARLALVVAHEKGLLDRLELTWADPWKNPADLVSVNPFSRVPALVTDDGTVLVESGCICDYFDHFGSGHRLIPEALDERKVVLRKLGVAKTLTEVTFGAVIARRFGSPGAEPALAARWIAAAGGAMDAMEGDRAFGRETVAPDLGDIALAVALGYIDFRLKQMSWENGRPKLAAWFRQISARDSMKATPHE